MSVKERLGGGGHPQRVLTQSQVPVILDEAALKEASEAREKEREKVSPFKFFFFPFFFFSSFYITHLIMVLSFRNFRQLLPSKRVRKSSPPKKR